MTGDPFNWKAFAAAQEITNRLHENGHLKEDVSIQGLRTVRGVIQKVVEEDYHGL